MWVPSRGMNLELYQILVSYTHKVCVIIALEYFADRTEFRSKVLHLGWCLLLSFGAYRVPFHVIDMRTCGWQFHVNSSSTSPRSVSCVGVVFNNRALPSVCGEKPVVLETVWILAEFPRDSFSKQCSWMKLGLSPRSFAWWQERPSWGSISLGGIRWNALWVYTKSGRAGSWSKLIPIFLRNHHIDFHSGCTDLPFHYQWGKSSPYSTSLSAWAVTCAIDLSHSDRCKMESQCSFDLHFPDG